MIRIGLVGCGGIARGGPKGMDLNRRSGHFGGYRELKTRNMGDFSISAVCDVIKENAKSLAKDIEWFQKDRPIVYSDLGEMLSDNVVDAVDVCTPVFLHHQMAIRCAEAGVHATVEKPFGITVKAIHKMIEAAEKNGTILGLSENLRRFENIRATRWLIDEGYLGDLRILLGGGFGFPNWKGDEIIVGTPWRHSKLKAGAGGVIDFGSHSADTWRYLMGEVEEIVGSMKRFENFRVERDEQKRIVRKVENTVEDLALAIMKFENGALGQHYTGFGAPGEAGGHEQWVYGSKGCIKGDVMILNDRTKTNVVDFFKEKADEERKEKWFPEGVTDSFALELYDFVGAVTDQRRPESDGYDGLKSIAICYSIVESALVNHPVKVRDVEAGRIDAYQKEINEYYDLT